MRLATLHRQYIPPVLPMHTYMEWWDYFNTEPEPFGFVRQSKQDPQTFDQQLALLRGH